MFIPLDERLRGARPLDRCPVAAPLLRPFTPMNSIAPAPSAGRGRRRGGRRPVALDRLRSRRLDVDVSAAELAVIEDRARLAAMPLRRWARTTLLDGAAPTVAVPMELRQLWSDSSPLQSNANQLVERLNELRRAGQLDWATAAPSLRGLAEIAPRLYALVCRLRLELLGARSK